MTDDAYLYLGTDDTDEPQADDNGHEQAEDADDPATDDTLIVPGAPAGPPPPLPPAPPAKPTGTRDYGPFLS